MMTQEEWTALCKEFIEHLDYCGWGDKCERECIEKLRRRIEKMPELQ